MLLWLTSDTKNKLTQHPLSETSLLRWFRWLQHLRSKYLLSRAVRVEHKHILWHKIWIACSNFTGLCEISSRLMRNSPELVRWA